MNDINVIIRTVGKPLLKFHNLPDDKMSESATAEFFWQKLGINIEPSMISVKGKMAFVAVPADSLADFFQRALSETDITVSTFDQYGASRPPGALRKKPV